MERLLVGRVSYYNEAKQFGFIVSAGGKSHFFHATAGGETRVNENGQYVFRALKKGSKPSNFPGVGDQVLFFCENDHKGSRASCWYILPKSKAKDILMSKETVYRFMHKTHVPGTEFKKETAICEHESNDVLGIASELPRSKTVNFSCDDYDSWYWCERKTATGWEETTDPRPYFIK